MQQDNSYYFTNHNTVLTLRHNIGEQIKGIKIRFTNAEGESVEYEDQSIVGDQVDTHVPMRRGLSMSYRNLQLSGKSYNIIVEGVADSSLDTLTVTATVQEIGPAGAVELEDPEYVVELQF